MSQLTAYTLLNFDSGYHEEFGTGLVKATAQIYRGSAVGNTSGYARQLVAGDTFQGFAEEDALGSSADGAVTVGLRTGGRVELAITSCAVTDVGKDVFASDGATYTFTAGSNTFVGKAVRFVSTGLMIVDFNVGRS